MKEARIHEEERVIREMMKWYGRTLKILESWRSAAVSWRGCLLNGARDMCANIASSILISHHAGET